MKKGKIILLLLIFVILLSIASTALFIFYNRETEPKIDQNGNPIFIDFTNQVYTNPKEYLGYYVTIKGQVFQNVADNGETKDVQVWIDPVECDKNVMIRYTNDVDLKDGDYIICTGYIQELYKYTNTFGTEILVPMICSSDVSHSNYIDVVSPTISSITPENLTYENKNCSITIDKIEFAENETRLYLTAQNNSNTTLYIDTDSSVIIQNQKQYNIQYNYQADYAEIPYDLKAGTTMSGIVVFPSIEDLEFDYLLEIYLDTYEGWSKDVILHIIK